MSTSVRFIFCCHYSGLTPDSLQELAADPEQLGLSAQAQLEKFIGQIKNHLAQPVKKRDLPELANVERIPYDAPIPTDIITTATGKTYIIHDATDALGIKNKQSGQEYAVLCAKFTNRLNELNANGQPQIMQPDSKMQKVIRQGDGSTTQEMRMSGKNRFYFKLTPLSQDPNNPNSPLARIVVLGDEKTQQRFIDAIV